MKYFTKNVDINKTCLNRSQEDIRTDIEEMKTWISTQKHLPKEAADERLLEKFVLSGKGNLDKAKSRLDSYFTVRNFISYIYSNRDPLDHENLKHNNDSYVGLFPGLTPDGSRVMYINVPSKDPSRFDQKSLTLKVFNIIDIWLRDDPHAISLYILCDSENGTVGHVMKLSISGVKESLHCVQNVLPISIKGLYLLNTPNIVRVLVENIIKPLLSNKLAKRFSFFSKDCSKLYNDIPLEMMPRDYGGGGPSATEINEAWIEIVKQNREWLLTFGNAKTDESLRKEKCKFEHIIKLLGADVRVSYGVGLKTLGTEGRGFVSHLG